jgi:hypothetical protein
MIRPPTDSFQGDLDIHKVLSKKSTLSGGQFSNQNKAVSYFCLMVDKKAYVARNDSTVGDDTVKYPIIFQ